MQENNHGILTCNNLVAQRTASAKPIDGKSLVTQLNRLSKQDLKRSRTFNHFKAIPNMHFESLIGLGRGKYRAIVVSTYMSLLWDGWKSKKKTKRKPNNKVMVTRRMLEQHFNLCSSTAGEALKDLVYHEKIIIAQKHVFSGKHGQNRGTLYRLPWMEKPKGKTLYIYWGLLTSDSFLELKVTLQAVIILLHRLHNRRKNLLTIRPGALSQYGIHRNRLPGYISDLTDAGLLIYIENYDYEFAWIDGQNQLDFYRIKKFRRTYVKPTLPSSQTKVKDMN